MGETAADKKARRRGNKNNDADIAGKLPPEKAEPDTISQWLMESAWTAVTLPYYRPKLFAMLVGVVIFPAIAAVMLPRQGGNASLSCEGFSHVAGPSASTNSRLLVLAERHGEPATKACLEKSERDVVLLEMVPAGVEANCDIVDIKTHEGKPKCIGWDTSARADKVFQASNISAIDIFLSNADGYRQGSLAEDNLESHLSRVLKLAQKAKKELEKNHGFTEQNCHKHTEYSRAADDYREHCAYLKRAKMIKEMRNNNKTWGNIFDSLEKDYNALRDDPADFCIAKDTVDTTQAAFAPWMATAADTLTAAIDEQMQSGTTKAGVIVGRGHAVSEEQVAFANRPIKHFFRWLAGYDTRDPDVKQVQETVEKYGGTILSMTKP